MGHIAAHSHNGEQDQGQQSGPPLLVSKLVGLIASAAFSTSVLLSGPPPSLARPVMTPDERLTIDIFKKATPSGVGRGAGG